jgi:hypothetical protein
MRLKIIGTFTSKDILLVQCMKEVDRFKYAIPELSDRLFIAMCNQIRDELGINKRLTVKLIDDNTVSVTIYDADKLDKVVEVRKTNCSNYADEIL